MSTEAWMRAIHKYEPDQEGRCISGWHNDHGTWVKCSSSQRASVLHDDPEADFRERHSHGGGDCMCFEDMPGGYHEAMKEYVEGRSHVD